MDKKLLYSMGEVAEMFDVTPSLLRHWEREFEQIKPQRNKKGNRQFTPSDIETIKVIYHLVRERGMTLEGAKQALKANKLAGSESGKSVELRDMQIVERLQKLRSSLLELRDTIDKKPQPRRKSKEETVSSGELFAFYEQRLF